MVKVEKLSKNLFSFAEGFFEGPHLGWNKTLYGNVHFLNSPTTILHHLEISFRLPIAGSELGLPLPSA